MYKRQVQAQEADPGSTLSLYRSMLALRRSEPALRGEDFAWVDSSDGVVAFRRGEDLLCLVNLGPAAVALPPHSSVLLTSDGLVAGTLPTDTAVWLRR